MARGDKRNNLRVGAIHQMVEALIQEENDEAIAALQTYLRLKTRSILGEDDDSEEMKSSKKSKSRDDSDEVARKASGF